MERATIDDVARAAGVSRQTVSNVVNRRGRVGEDTRARVEATVAELGYRPNLGASSMRSKRTRMLGHPMAPTEQNPNNAALLEIIQALAKAAGDTGHHLLLTAVRGDGTGDGAAEVAELIQHGAVDAFVLTEVVPGDARVALLAARRVPFACFGRTDPDMPQNWVSTESRAEMRRMTEHVLGRGHRRIAFLGTGATPAWQRNREAGYRAAMAAAGLPGVVVRPVGNPGEPDGVVAAIEGLLDAPRPPSAVLTSTDELAAAVYAVARQRGLRIGEDLAVTGYDGSAAGRLLTPALTTVAIPFDEISRRVVARALREIDGPTGEPGEIIRARITDGASA